MTLFALAMVPVFIWLWRGELVNLVADCIAEGIKRSRDQASTNDIPISGV